jgi:hypothetical protein
MRQSIVKELDILGTDIRKHDVVRLHKFVTALVSTAEAVEAEEQHL